MTYYGMPRPIDAERIKIINDDERIDLGEGVVLRSIWTPGHATHHLSYVLEGEKVVFTGDAVGITYPAFPVLIPTTPPTSFSLPEAVESLQRIRKESPTRLLTPHYGIVDNALDSIDANIRSLPEWTENIEAMLHQNLSADAISKRLAEEISRKGAKGRSGIPDYAETSIRISVLGVIRYLELRSKLGAVH